MRVALGLVLAFFSASLALALGPDDAGALANREVRHRRMAARATTTKQAAAATSTKKTSTSTKKVSTSSKKTSSTSKKATSTSKATSTKASSTKATSTKATSATTTKTPSTAIATSCAPKYTGAATTISKTGTLPVATSFVTRSGSLLKLGGKTFTPVGVNIYWLGLQGEPSVQYPDKGRVREALAIAVAMGSNVVRCNSCGISTGNPLSVMPSLGVVNEAALAAIDYAVFAAKRYGLRLIIPLSSQYHYYQGGHIDFVNWRGKSTDNYGNMFYTDSTLIGDFKSYINALLTHVNTYTGVALKDEPAIMAWETGNEYGAYMLGQGAPPASFTNTIATYIKSLAPKHLVIDGTDGLTQQNGTAISGLKVSAVDIVSDHFYPPSTSLLKTDFALSTKAQKALIIGEMDWTQANGDSSLSTFYPAIEADAGVGSLIWSIWGHDEQCCAYMQHNDGYSLYYPNGNIAALQSNILKVMQHNYRTTGRTVPSKLPAVACPQPVF